MEVTLDTLTAVPRWSLNLTGIAEQMSDTLQEALNKSRKRLFIYEEASSVNKF